MPITKPVLLPTPPRPDEEVHGWLRDALIPALTRAFESHLHGYPQSIRGEIRAKAYTTATKPSAAEAGTGAIIFVSDGGAGAIFQGSDGTNWVNLG